VGHYQPVWAANSPRVEPVDSIVRVKGSVRAGGETSGNIIFAGGAALAFPGLDAFDSLAGEF
jgi:hypothetical protein